MKPDAAKFCECKEPLLDSDCGFHPFCHRCGLAIKETPAAVEKDIEENLRLMNHGIIYQQPEKEWWEESFDAIFSNRMSVDSASGEQVFFKQKVELIKSFISRIAAQSQKKGEEKGYMEGFVDAYGTGHERVKQEGRDEREKEILAAIDATAYDEARAARSSEEGKTNNK